MAQLLHDTYGYSYDNMKVLLGGWNSWNDLHSQNPNQYPTDGTPQPASNGGVVGTPIPIIGNGTVVINVNPTQAPAKTAQPTASK